MKIMKFITLAFIGVCAVILVGCGSKGKSPEDVAVAYVTYAYKGDADSMMKLMYLPKEDMKDGGEDFVKGKIKQAATKAAAEADRKGGVKEIVVESSEIDDPNGKGVVKVVTHFKNEGSQSQKQNVRVVRSNEQWKVNL